jgi:hypothetical protein
MPLRGDDEGDLDFDPPAQHDASHRLQSTEPTVWYVRWGQAISGFFSSIREKFNDLWRGVSNAGDAVARFFSARGATSDVDLATKNIKEPPVYLAPDLSGDTQPLSSPTIYFALPENTKNEEIPEERTGLLGAIPVAELSTSEASEAAKPLPEAVSPGQQKFETYLAARSKQADLQEYIADEECLRYAELVFKPLFVLQSKPDGSLSDEQKVIYEAAKELRSANSDYKNRIKEERQKKQKEVEHVRQAELAASKQPGQADFEDFVAAFERHRADNLPFMIYDGSKYLHQACLNYAQRNSENLSADQRQALEYLLCWHKNPQGSKQRLEGAPEFVNLRQEVLEPMAVSAESRQTDLSASIEMIASTPPPPRPAPRWTFMLTDMKALEPQQVKRIAGVLDMQEDQIRKAMKGLRAIAEITSASGALDVRKSGGAHAIEQALNYDAEASRRDSDLLESLELANRLVKKLKDGDALVFDPDEQEVIGKLKSVIDNVADALKTKLQALLPDRRTATAQEKASIPSLLELNNEQASVGSNLFQTYVDGYTKRSNKVNYTIAERSNYFKPECLAFAKAFTEQVEHMRGAFTVDDNRLAASYYLLAEARKRGLI